MNSIPILIFLGIFNVVYSVGVNDGNIALMHKTYIQNSSNILLTATNNPGLMMLFTGIVLLFGSIKAAFTQNNVADNTKGRNVINNDICGFHRTLAFEDHLSSLITNKNEAHVHIPLLKPIMCNDFDYSSMNNIV
mmetsp:Transcript_86255/g.105846  ORF Transcript_86255/g.105846 Transcript_86255/m.105846 type:complete len:135 (-) Transcript_86255:5-409(-)